MKKIILSLCFILHIPLYVFNNDDNGIFDFVPSRDLYAVKSIIEDNDTDVRHNFSTQELKSFDSIFCQAINSAYVYDVLLNTTKSDEYIVKVLRIDGKTIGCMMYHFDGMTLSTSMGMQTWDIDLLVVDKKYHHHNYESIMLQYLMTDVQACGGDRIIAFYPLYNQKVEQLYNKHGFKTQDVGEFFQSAKMINHEDLDQLNQNKALMILKSFYKYWFFIELINNQLQYEPVKFYELMNLIIDGYIQSIDNLTIEELYGSDYFNSFGESESFNFDKYKVNIKNKLQKIKAALELEGPEYEMSWLDYLRFKVVESLLCYR